MYKFNDSTATYQDYAEFNILKDVIKLDYHTQVKEMMIINDVLYMLVSRYALGNNCNAGESGILEQYGVLVAVDLNHPRNVHYIGLNNSKSGTLTSYYSGEEYPLDIIGNSNTDDLSFYAPQRIVAIKDKDMYIADAGLLLDEDEQRKEKLKAHKLARIVRVDLSQFCIDEISKVYEDLFKLDTHGDYNLGSTNYSYWND